MKAIAERRNDARMELHEPVRLRPITKPVSPEQLAETVNMSQGGICVATDYPLRLGAEVELYVRIPRELSREKPGDYRCLARVVHIHRGMAGTSTEVGMRVARYECLNLRDRWVS